MKQYLHGIQYGSSFGSLRCRAGHIVNLQIRQDITTTANTKKEENTYGQG